MVEGLQIHLAVSGSPMARRIRLPQMDRRARSVADPVLRRAGKAQRWIGPDTCGRRCALRQIGEAARNRPVAQRIFASGSWEATNGICDPLFPRMLMGRLHNLSAFPALEVDTAEYWPYGRPEFQKNLIMTKYCIAAARRFLIVSFIFVLNACAITPPKPWHAFSFDGWFDKWADQAELI